MAAPNKKTASDSEEEVSWPEEKPVKVKSIEDRVESIETQEENKIIDESIMEPEQSQQQNQNSNFGLEMRESKSGGKNWLLIIGLVLLVVAIAGGGYFFYKSSMTSNEEIEATPMESPFTLATPASSPIANNDLDIEIDRASWNLEVLNGTGKTGLAASVKEKLEEMGYTVSKTGNAPDAATTKILVNKKMSADQDALLADLKDEFMVETAGVLSDSSASARIVLGKDYLK